MSGRVLRTVSVVVVVSVGCVGWFVLSGRGRTIEVGDATVMVSERLRGGMDAGLGGELTVIDGCLGVAGTVVVWPHGTDVVDDDPLTIELPSHRTSTVGGTIELGGGYGVEHSTHDVEPGPLDVAGVTIPSACARHDIFLASS